LAAKPRQTPCAPPAYPATTPTRSRHRGANAPGEASGQRVVNAIGGPYDAHAERASSYGDEP
jgi:hypothetical protein